MNRRKSLVECGIILGDGSDRVLARRPWFGRLSRFLCEVLQQCDIGNARRW
jgi:hypothetical protein